MSTTLTDGWYLAGRVADVLEIDAVQSVFRYARSYMHRYSAGYPILCKKMDRPDQHKRKYRYRLDGSAQWRGRHLAQLTTHPEWSRTKVATELDISDSAIGRIIRRDLWIARPIQPDVARLYGADPDEEIRQWWAVCDLVLGRLVVSSTHDSPGPAKRALERSRAKGTCPGTVARGTGTPPEVGLRVRRDRLEAVGVGS